MDGPALVPKFPTNGGDSAVEDSDVSDAFFTSASSLTAILKGGLLSFVGSVLLVESTIVISRLIGSNQTPV